MNICSVLSLFILGLFLDPALRPPLPFGFSPAGDDCAEEGVSPAGVVGVAAALGLAAALGVAVVLVRPPLPFGFSPAGDDCAEEGVSPAAALGVAVVLVGDGDGGGVTLSGRIGDVSGVVCEAGCGLAGFDLKIIN